LKIEIDTDARTLTVYEKDEPETMPLYSDPAFEIISRQWLNSGWNQKYVYTFSWMGRPIIQLPEDLIRLQEVIYRVKPRVVVETGVAHGGSLVFHASMFRAMGIEGKVVGVDIEIRPHNRTAIENHELSGNICLVEGDSTRPETVCEVHRLAGDTGPVMVILDSNHSRAHVLNELEAYHDLVSPGSYLVVTDGIMGHLTDVPRGDAAWEKDNPMAAVMEFVQENPDFSIEQPTWPFNESTLQNNVTHWPSAWLRRKD
jgi:cephalosporin hydroxylase